MALPTCPKCDNTIFEVNQFTPMKSAFKLYAVNCTKCGAVVSVQEYNNIGAMLEKMAKALRINL